MNRRVVGLCAVSTAPQANKDEKVSLEEQERLIRERVAAEGDALIDMLIIPGFSRRYYNLYDLIDAASRAGHDAPRRLLEHIERRDFDVLMCRYGNRFAREQSIFGEIVARVIDSGAEIFTLADGLIHAGNYRMYISMAGYAAATEIDRLVQGRKDAMRKRAARGLPTSSGYASSHRLVRDGDYKPLRLEVNPDKRRFLDDLATLLLEGIGYGEIGNALWERFGHLSSAGLPYTSSTIGRLLQTPTFWGHTAQNYNGDYHAGKTVKRSVHGAWAYDESIPPPEGVTVYRNTHEPAYTGALAERVKNELRRRSFNKGGRAGAHHANPFSGLLVCAACGCRMIHVRPEGRSYYICPSANARYRYTPRGACDAKPRTIGTHTVQAWLNDFLDELTHSHNPLAFRFGSDAEDNVGRGAQLDTEIAAAKKRIAGLLLQRADTPPASQTILSELLQTEDTRLQTLQQQRRALDYAAATAAAQVQAAAASVDELRAAWERGFWHEPPDTINRLLFSLLGDYKIWIRNGAVDDIKPAPR